jgi:hypothetical protein
MTEPIIRSMNIYIIFNSSNYLTLSNLLHVPKFVNPRHITLRLTQAPSIRLSIHRGLSEMFVWIQVVLI